MMRLAFLQGLLIGFALITPIGPQNLFVLDQGLLSGIPRVLVPAVTAALCDSSLILLGAAGGSIVLAGVPRLQGLLVSVGVAFLLVLGFRQLRAPAEEAESTRVRAGRGVALQTLGVSLLNPHAILDTVGVIGGAIAAQASTTRGAFAMGAISASWIWFLALGSAASVLQDRLTSRGRLWLHRLSGSLMLLFAVLLAFKLLPS
jgi:L-lysine exporter family protein LysE/ArgO